MPLACLEDSKFESIHATPNIDQIISHAIEYYYFIHTPHTTKITHTIYVKWHPPGLGTFKLNTDGAPKVHHAFKGFGGFFRDFTGNWILVFAANRTTGTHIYMELCAFLKRSQIALR